MYWHFSKTRNVKNLIHFLASFSPFVHFSFTLLCIRKDHHHHHLPFSWSRSSPIFTVDVSEDGLPGIVEDNNDRQLFLEDGASLPAIFTLVPFLECSSVYLGWWPSSVCCQWLLPPRFGGPAQQLLVSSYTCLPYKLFQEKNLNICLYQQRTNNIVFQKLHSPHKYSF